MKMRNTKSQKAFYDFTTALEGIEKALSVAGFTWDRLSDEEIKLTLAGRWCDYAWRRERTLIERGVCDMEVGET